MDKKKIVLFVEKNLSDIEKIKLVLKNLKVDHEFQIARSMIIALGMMVTNTIQRKKITPDILLLNINRNTIEAIEFLQIIRSCPRLRNIKVIVVSSVKEDYSKINSKELRVTGYLLKPLNFQDANSKRTLKMIASSLIGRDKDISN